MNQRFEVPYNFDMELIDRLEPYKDYIDFIYTSSFYTDGDNTRKDLILNNSVPKDWNDYVEHIRKIRRLFEVGILIQEGSSPELIEKYYNLGIRIFIISDDNIAKNIKEKYFDVRCILSITKRLTLEEIQTNDYSMYDEIVLYFNFCRQQHLLKQLPDKYRYVLIVNSHCVYNCNRSALHWNLDADSIEHYNTLVHKIIDGYCCGPFREDRAFIQPNDLVYFTDKITNFKLVDRLDESNEIIYNIDRYTKEYENTKHEIEWYQLGGEE